MAFEFVQEPWSVVDKERDIVIGVMSSPYSGGDQGDRLEFSKYTFSKGNLSFLFKVARIEPRVAWPAQEVDPYDVTKPGVYTSFILEDSLLEGLTQGLHRAPTDQEYVEVKKMIQDGLNTMAHIATSKSTAGHIYQVLSDKNMDEIAEKYPGRLPNYENWSRFHP